jgi:hypothetical protein
VRLAFLHLEFSNPFTYRELARRMVKSVHEVMPDVEIVQMGDGRTPTVPGVDSVVELRIKPNEEFMPYRLRHLSRFEKEAIFLDTDIIVKRDLREAFRESFDVGLTKRDYPVINRDSKENITEKMPYNTGVMFSRNPDFFQAAYEHCLRLPEEKRQWWGDQIAVNYVAKSGKYKVVEFDCGLWNRVPVRADDVGDAYVVHFKGSTRKTWMLA